MLAGKIGVQRSDRAMKTQIRIPTKYYDIDLIELLILEKIGHISAKLDA